MYKFSFWQTIVSKWLFISKFLFMIQAERRWKQPNGGYGAYISKSKHSATSPLVLLVVSSLGRLGKWDEELILPQGLN